MKEKICRYHSEVSCHTEPDPITCLNCIHILLVDNFNLLYKIASSGLVSFLNGGKVFTVSKNNLLVTEMYEKWLKQNLPEKADEIIYHHLKVKNIPKDSSMVI